MTKTETIVTKTTLHNGLTLVLKEMHHAPVTSFMIWYRVGSRNERPGITGASHWVEHMMFRGTPTFPGGVLDRMVSREGGHWNAFTWLDFTAYYETMPARRIDLALRLEADRMVNALMSPEDVEAERTVILSERGMYANDPRFRLGESLTAVAFHVHPYRHEVIGDEADLRSMTRDDLMTHYRRHYVPNNAVAVVVGDFDTAVMVERITELFGGIPAGDLVPANKKTEPPQEAERRVTVTGTDSTPHLIVAYKAPAVGHPDYLPLSLLNAAFTGGSSLGMFGGGGSNKSSRLYRALVSTELAVSAHGGLTPSVDPFLYMINVTPRNGRDLNEIEAALENEINRLAASPINQAELDKALKRAKAGFVMAGESITGQTQLLGLAETVVGDYRWFENVLDRLSRVTLADIERVRQTYLRPEQRTVGVYRKDEG